MTVDELERAASAGEPMPLGLTDYEMDFFEFMTSLYWRYRQGLIGLEEAKKTKQRRRQKLEARRIEAQAQEKTRRMWLWLNLREEADDCPKCRELKKTILQLENCF